MEVIQVILVMGLLVETLVRYTATIRDGGKISYKMILSIILGLVVSVVYQLDLVNIVTGLEHSIVGVIFTGFLISGGSNLLHEFIDKLGRNGNVNNTPIE